MTGRVSRSAITARLKAVPGPRPRTLRLPVVAARSRERSGATDRARVLRQAGEVLHGHLAAAPTRKRSTDAELAAKLDGLGIWPVLPREALAAGLAPVLADARRLWEMRPPDPVRCADCGNPRDEDVCELHRRVRYAWLDVLDRLAARIVDEVPARARAQMRSGS